jgi:hypothetical protein
MSSPLVVVTANYASEFQRATVNAVDADASQLPPIGLGGAQSVRLGATCGTANASLSLRLYFIDSQGRVISTTAITFTAGNLPDWGAQYSGMPSYDPCWPVGGGRALVVKCDNLTPGSVWNLAGAWA